MIPRSRTLTVVSGLLFAAPLLFVMSGGCSVADPDVEEEEEAHEPTGTRDDEVVNGTVEDAMKQTCVTSSVKPLSEQIIAEMRCIDPDGFVEVPSRPNLHLEDNIFPYLVAGARDALVRALDKNPSRQMHVASMFRTVAQQYLLHRWYQTGRCSIGLAASPGRSNHETGLALDVSETSAWRSSLEAQGFDWLGSKDAPHYDYEGAGAVDRRGLDVKAFQRLWDRNNPNDKIGDDGVFGPKTLARLKKTPAKGFPIGATCQGNPDPDPDPDPDPNPQACEDFTSAELTCAGDGNSRGKCVSDQQTEEACARGCLIQAGEDVCMGTTSTWSCSGTTGKTKMQNGDYVATAFGCWTDANGQDHSDSGDNCIPACFSQLKQSGACTSGMSGPECERHINWFAADRDRFGCGAKLRVTNPDNGKTAVVMVIDAGPACWVEDQVDTGVVDLSYRVTEYLFGGAVGVSDKEKVHVVEVDASTPLGPVP